MFEALRSPAPQSEDLLERLEFIAQKTLFSVDRKLRNIDHIFMWKSKSAKDPAHCKSGSD